MYINRLNTCTYTYKQAVECRLDGSPEVQRLDLNSKFELSVKVVLQGYQGSHSFSFV